MKDFKKDIFRNSIIFPLKCIIYSFNLALQISMIFQAYVACLKITAVVTNLDKISIQMIKVIFNCSYLFGTSPSSAWNMFYFKLM